MFNSLVKLIPVFHRVFLKDRYCSEVSNYLDVCMQIRDWLANQSHENISIGENCNSSWYLKVTSNKRASYPFDWIFSSPMIVLDVLETDFSYFLDKSLIYSKNPQFKGGHCRYHASMFNHKNPLESASNYDYYKRAVDRFRTVLNSGKSILFVCTVLNEADKRKDWSLGFNDEFQCPINQNPDSFSDLLRYLKTKNPNVKLLCIEQFTGSGFRKCELMHVDSNFLWLKNYSHGINNGVKFLDFYDDFFCTLLYRSLY